MQTCGLILLAAGASKRMGQPKQLLQVGNKSLLQHSIATALQADVEPIILVTGADAGLVEKEVHDAAINVVENVDWEEGIASSIRCGINALLEIMPDIEQAICMVCDQPFVSSSLLNELISASAETGDDIVACAYGNTVGTPVLFGKNYFAELLQLQGDEGAKKLLKKYSDTVGTVSFPKGDIDIDTMQDYEAWKDNAGNY